MLPRLALVDALRRSSRTAEADEFSTPVARESAEAAGLRFDAFVSGFLARHKSELAVPAALTVSRAPRACFS